MKKARSRVLTPFYRWENGGSGRGNDLFQFTWPNWCQGTRVDLSLLNQALYIKLPYYQPHLHDYLISLKKPIGSWKARVCFTDIYIPHSTTENIQWAPYSLANWFQYCSQPSRTNTGIFPLLLGHIGNECYIVGRNHEHNTVSQITFIFWGRRKRHSRSR